MVPALLAGVLSVVRRNECGRIFAGISVDMMPPCSNIEGIKRRCHTYQDSKVCLCNCVLVNNAIFKAYSGTSA